jgi:predicted dehydrogenase
VRSVSIGVIGCGWIGHGTHVPVLSENPKARLVAICDANEVLLKKTGDKYGIQNRFRDYRELLDSGLVEAVSICTPTTTHSEIALTATKAGIHVLCEKPLASNLPEAQLVASAVRDKKTCFMVGYNYRFLPNHIKAKDLVHSGKIGQPILIRGELVAPGPYRNGANESEVAMEAEKRKGCLFDLGSHIADLFIWIMGDPIDVYAAFVSIGDSVLFDRTAVAMVRFKSNVLGTIAVTWQNLPDYEAMSDARVIEIIGTKGKIDSEFFGPSLFFYSSDSITSKIRGRIRMTPMKVNPNVPDDALKSSYKKEIDSFLDAVISSEQPPVTVDDGIRALRLVVSAYESAKLGRAVTLG